MPTLLIEIIDGIAIEGFMPDGAVDVAYSAQLRAMFAVQPVEWSIESGALPPGWTLDEETGEISGETEEAGSYAVTIMAIDWEGNFTHRTFVFRVVALPLLLVGTVAPITVGSAGSDELTLTGGAKPRSITLAVLPAGKSASLNDTTGVLTISGTATGAGLGIGYNKTFAASVTIEDEDGSTSTWAQLIDITVPTLIVTGSAPDGVVGTGAVHNYGTTGGVLGAKTFTSVPSPAIPGKTLSSSGALSGTPTLAGTYAFDVYATDSEGNVSAGHAESMMISPPAYATWNPSAKGSDVDLSNANLTATRNSDLAFAYNNARANVALSGKMHFEVTIQFAGSGGRIYLGIGTSALALEGASQYVGSNSSSVGFYGPGNLVWVNSVNVGTYVGSGTTTVTYAIEYDAATGKIWITDVSKPGWWGGGDPALGTSPTYTMPLATYYPIITLRSAVGAASDRAATANFGATTFARTPSAGFGAVL